MKVYVLVGYDHDEFIIEAVLSNKEEAMDSAHTLNTMLRDNVHYFYRYRFEVEERDLV